MKSKILATILITSFAIALAASPLSVSAPVGIPILIDLSHKQPSMGVDVIIRMVPEAQWYVLVDSKEAADALPSAIKENAVVLVGDFATVGLEKLGIAMVIFGQPQTALKPEEVAALAKWFSASPGRALWVSADSDYPAQGSELSQHVANTIMEAVGARLRMDYTSAYDYLSNAGNASYRVLAFVNVSEVPALRYGCDRVLFHGPGPLAWVDDAGRWRKLSPNEKPANVFIIAMTSPESEITENQAEPKGTTAKVYKPGDRGPFVLMAAEYIPVKGGFNIVVLSGETPYGGYQPGATWSYYGVRISGPQFVRNVILWATGYMGELREYEKLAKLPDEVSARVDALSKDLTGRVESLSRDLTSRVESAIAGITSTLNLALGLAAIALILAIVALALSFRKPKTAK